MNQSQPLSNPTNAEQAEAAPNGKAPFVEPKLTWLEPQLVKQGTVTDVTAGFFQPFYPAQGRK